MSESNLLLRIRKVNTVLVLIVCLAVLSLFGYLAWLAFVESSGSRHEPAVVHVGGEEEDAPDLRLGGFSRIPGLDFVKAPLTGELASSNFSSGDSWVTRNYLFFNLEDSTSSWLLGNNRSLFEWTQVVTRREGDGQVSGVPEWRDDEDDKCGPAVALLYHVVSTDTNGDGKVTNKDSGAFAASRPDGTGFKILVEGVDRVLRFDTNAAGDGFVFYIASGALHAVRLDISALTVLEDTDISSATGLNRIAGPNES